MSPDIRLLERYYQEGDKSALDELFTRHYPAVYQTILHLVFDSFDARDLAQATFLKATRSAGTFDGSGSFRAWLLTIAVNEVRQHRRRFAQRSRKDWLHDALPRPEHSRSASEDATRREFEQQLERVLEGMPARLTEPLVLHYYESLSYAEIAAVLGVSKSTVQSRIRQAVEELRKGFRGAGALALLPCIGRYIEVPPLAGGTIAVGGGVASLWMWGGLVMKTKLAVLAGCLLLVVGIGWSVSVAFSAPSEVLPSVPLKSVQLEQPLKADEAAELPGAAMESMRKSVLAKAKVVPATGSLLVTVYHADGSTPAVDVGVNVAASADPNSGRSPLRLQTGSDGIARFEDLPLGPVSITTNRMHFGLHDTKRLNIEAGEEADVSITLPKGVNLTGVVVDRYGIAVPGAVVHLGGYLRERAEPATVAGSDGRFNLRAVAANFCVGAYADGYAPSKMHMMRSGGQGLSINLRIVLPGPGGSLEGQVLDPQGQAVANAVVRIGDTDRVGHVVTLPDGAPGLKPAPLMIRTDHDGRFRSAGLPPGEVKVLVYTSGWPLAVKTCVIAAHTKTQLIIGLSDGVSLHGSIRDVEGNPAGGVKVAATDPDQLEYRSSLSNADGRFLINGLRPGKLKLAIRSVAYGDLTKTVEGEAGDRVEWHPQFARTVSLTGRVTNVDGVPIEGAWVSVRDRVERANWARQVETDAAGSFTILGCPSGLNPVVIVGKADFDTVTSKAVDPSAGVLEVVIKRESEGRVNRIVGRVIDADGRPAKVATVSVRLRGSGNSSPLSIDVETGRFRSRATDPGIYELTVSSPGFALLRSLDHVLVAGKTLDVGDLCLVRGGLIEVHVDASRVADTEALKVELRDKDQVWRDYIQIENSIGHSRRHAPGRYFLMVRGKAIAARMIPIVVRADEKLDVDVVLAPGVPFDLLIQPPLNGPRVARVQVKVSSADGTVHVHSVGRLIVRPDELRDSLGLAPGRYTIVVTGLDGLKGRLDLDVSKKIAGKTIEVSLRK